MTHHAAQRNQEHGLAEESLPFVLKNIIYPNEAGRLRGRAGYRIRSITMRGSSTREPMLSRGRCRWSRRPAPSSTNGLVGYPTYLPKSTLHYDSDALIVGTAARPALTSQGDPVKVVTPHRSVVAVVTGQKCRERASRTRRT